MDAAHRYEQLEAHREPYLRRARDCAALTIPTLLLPSGWSPQRSLPTPYQSIGGQGLASLASKLLLALFPPSAPFFRLLPGPRVQAALPEGKQAEADRELVKAENAIMRELESESYRPFLHEAIKQLLVAGNALLYLPRDGGMKLYKLDRYVLRRTAAGVPREIIVKEVLPPGTAPADVVEQVTPNADTNKEPWDIYTVVKWDEVTGKWRQFQQVKGHEVLESAIDYTKEELPWLPLRLEPITGESYGYGYISILLGDLKTLEGLTKAITRGSIAAARLLWLVNPGGFTSVKDLAEAEDGGFIPGREEDVVALALGNKAYDLRVTGETVAEVVSRMNRAFLLHTSVQRDAERVTAQEIRYLAQELESVLAGTYALLSVEFQMPLVKLLLSKLQKNGTIAEFPEDTVMPAVVTGLDALGRGSDLTRLDEFIQGVLQTFGPEAVLRVMNLDDYLVRRANALGLDIEGLIKSPDEIAANDQQAQLAQLVQQLGPDAMKLMANQQQPAA